ncbi:hypothetical protein JZ751_017883 [Albula glossodonta]|uniref:Protein SHQ1 homolog n=1 Tax=Albula glossodonta TaxID=121402 RepID=A0A8T2PPM9_9TELE|nr:hypothetical protein JZ751_017883 [Albula glossodonta]
MIEIADACWLKSEEGLMGVSLSAAPEWAEVFRLIVRPMGEKSRGSWLTEPLSNTYSSVQEVLVSFGRRVLCYPLYRHFDLVTAAVRDAALIFRSGQ